MGGGIGSRFDGLDVGSRDGHGSAVREFDFDDTHFRFAFDGFDAGGQTLDYAQAT